MTQPKTNIEHYDELFYSVQFDEVNGSVWDFKIYEMILTGRDGDGRYWRLKDWEMGTDMTPNLSEAEVFASGCIRFDGCMHLKFDSQEHCMLYFSGRKDFKALMALFDRIYDRAKTFYPGLEESFQ